MTCPQELVSQFLQSILRNKTTTWPFNSKHQSEYENLFLEISSKHALQPLIDYFIKESDSLDTWPKKVLEELNKNRLSLVAIDMLQAEEIKELQNKLSPLGIKPLLIKGSALSYTHYPSPGTRPRCDTDILILKQDIGAIFDVFEKIGYEYNPIDDLLTRQISFSKKGSMGIVHVFDVHWRINNRPLFFNTLTYNELARSPVYVPEFGPDAATISPVYALLLACFHRVGERAFGENEKLLWLYDIHLLFLSLSPDELQQYSRLAQEKRLSAICLNALESCTTHFDTPIPQYILDELSKPSLDEPSARLLQSEAARFMARDLIAQASIRDIIGGIHEALFPPADYLLHYYGTTNSLMLPLLYLRRLLRGIFRNGSGK